MEQKLKVSADKVFAVLTDPKWLEERCLALGELSASIKAKKSGGRVTLTMKRRIRRELPGLLAKVLRPESDFVLEETWSPAGDGGYAGTISMDLIGQPVSMTARFELEPEGKGCVYRVTHKTKSSVPLLGGAIEKFALAQTEKSCADELIYLAEHLKKKR